MKQIIIQFVPGVVRPAQAVYRRSDLALEYALQPGGPLPSPDIQASVDAAVGILPPKWLAIADALVMVFSGRDADFISLDAYTNIDLWTRKNRLVLPEVIGVGRVCLSDPPSDTDRIDTGIVPHFQYSEEQARLRIGFGFKRFGNRHYQVSECLIVGIDNHGLANLDVANLRII